MATLRFAAHWSGFWTKTFQIPKGFMLLEADERYHKMLHKVLYRLHQKQIELAKKHNGEELLYDLDVSINVQYRKRSLDANALMWSLYEIEAAVLNGGEIDHEKRVTAERLYDDDMRDLAPAVPIVVKMDVVELLPKSFGVKIRQIVPLQGGLCRAYVYKTSSQFDTLEMHRHINMLFNRIAAHGVHLEGKESIKHFWLQFRAEVDRRRMVLFPDTMTKAEYREANLLCEATGDYVGPSGDSPNGTGHVHHIRSRGAGGDEPEKDKASNWLILAPAAHEIWNQPDGGVEVFLQKYPHLVNKVRTALGQMEEGKDGGADEADDL